MAGPEYTHHNGQCTFEVLIERFKLRDSALRPIAEIVHDLDLEDSRYGREETADLYSAIDLLMDKIEQQIRKYKSKTRVKRRKAKT